MSQPPDTHVTATPGHSHGAEHITADPGHAHDHHADAALPFTDAELNSFHHDDRVAASAIVLLISGIFVIGVILYTIVDLAVSASP